MEPVAPYAPLATDPICASVVAGFIAAVWSIIPSTTWLALLGAGLAHQVGANWGKRCLAPFSGAHCIPHAI